jgi:hypothetical protein
MRAKDYQFDTLKIRADYNLSEHNQSIHWQKSLMNNSHV